MINILHKIFGISVKQKTDTNVGEITPVKENNQLAENSSHIKKPKIDVYRKPLDVYTNEELAKAISFGHKVQCDIVIRDGRINNLSPITTIEGTLGLSECNITSLSPLKIIHGRIWCSYNDKKPVLKTLGSLQRVEGDANFRYMPLENLVDLEYVGGNLSLRDTTISNLGNLRYVGGNLFLPKRLKELDLSHISVGGQIRFWNDVNTSSAPTNNGNADVLLKKSSIPVPYWPHTYIYPNHSIHNEDADIRNFYSHFMRNFENGVLLDTEGCSNYYFMLAFDLQRIYKDPCKLAEKYSLLTAGYPKLQPYCDDILINLYRQNNMFSQEWDIVKDRSYLSLKIVYDYIDKVGEYIFDGTVAARICGTSCLTSFGRTHKKEVLSFFRQCLQTFEEEQGCRFYDLFYDNNKDYKSIDGKYNPEYYRQFYKLDEGRFVFYNELEKSNHYQNPTGRIFIVEQAILEQLRLLLIKAEDAYRESIGVPKIGEGWVSETALFYKIKEHYKDYKVIHHGHPKWLGKQHIDIYFTNENIGIEYQGIQHYKAVDYFGGEEGFTKNQERDERKRQLCENNSCILIYVNEGYDFKEVVMEIDNAINIQQKKK